MCAAALTADHKIFVAPTAIDCVAEVEAACTLRKKGACFPAANGDEFPKHTYLGSFHQF